MTKIEKAWLAGFFDGEGCISTKSTHTLQIKISQKFPGVLYYIRDLLNFGNIDQRVKPEHLRIRITNKVDCKKFIEIILPYSVVKKSQLIIGLELLKLTQKAGIRLDKSAQHRRLQLTKELRRLKKVESVKKAKLKSTNL